MCSATLCAPSHIVYRPFRLPSPTANRPIAADRPTTICSCNTLHVPIYIGATNLLQPQNHSLCSARATALEMGSGWFNASAWRVSQCASVPFWFYHTRHARFMRHVDVGGIYAYIHTQTHLVVCVRVKYDCHSVVFGMTISGVNSRKSTTRLALVISNGVEPQRCSIDCTLPQWMIIWCAYHRHYSDGSISRSSEIKYWFWATCDV